MKLPGLDGAVVSPKKITGYLLAETHPNGRHKARYFTGLGFSVSSWERFAEALIQHASEHEVVKQEVSAFGIRYVIEGKIQSPDGRSPVIRAVWFMETNTTVPYFVTAYPL